MMVANTAMSLTANESVCSWICVSAWNNENKVPTIAATAIGGNDSHSVRYNAWVM